MEEVGVAVERPAGGTVQDPPLVAVPETVAGTETVTASGKAAAERAASRPAPAVARH